MRNGKIVIIFLFHLMDNGKRKKKRKYEKETVK